MKPGATVTKTTWMRWKWFWNDLGTDTGDEWQWNEISWYQIGKKNINDSV